MWRLNRRWFMRPRTCIYKRNDFCWPRSISYEMKRQAIPFAQNRILLFYAHIGNIINDHFFPFFSLSYKESGRFCSRLTFAVTRESIFLTQDFSDEVEAMSLMYANTYFSAWKNTYFCIETLIQTSIQK